MRPELVGSGKPAYQSLEFDGFVASMRPELVGSGKHLENRKIGVKVIAASMRPELVGSGKHHKNGIKKDDQIELQ